MENNQETKEKLVYPKGIELISESEFGIINNESLTIIHLQIKDDAIENTNIFTNALLNLAKYSFASDFDFRDLCSYFFGKNKQIIALINKENNEILAAIGIEDWKTELSQQMGYDIPDFYYLNSLIVHPNFRKANISVALINSVRQILRPTLLAAIAINPLYLLVLNSLKAQEFKIYPSLSLVSEGKDENTHSQNLDEGIFKIAKNINKMRLGDKLIVEDSLVIRNIVENPYNNPTLWLGYHYGEKYNLKEGDGIFVIAKKITEPLQ